MTLNLLLCLSISLSLNLWLLYSLIMGLPPFKQPLLDIFKRSLKQDPTSTNCKHMDLSRRLMVVSPLQSSHSSMVPCHVIGENLFAVAKSDIPFLRHLIYSFLLLQMFCTMILEFQSEPLSPVTTHSRVIPRWN